MGDLMSCPRTERHIKHPNTYTSYASTFRSCWKTSGLDGKCDKCMRWIAERGRYHQHLETWFSLFVRSRFLILESSMISHTSPPASVKAALDRVGRFLGLAGDEWSKLIQNGVSNSNSAESRLRGKGEKFKITDLDESVCQEMATYYRGANRRLYELLRSTRNSAPPEQPDFPEFLEPCPMTGSGQATQVRQLPNRDGHGDAPSLNSLNTSNLSISKPGAAGTLKNAAPYKAYVHIGPHKTGTTSFQLSLNLNGGLGDLLLPDGNRKQGGRAVVRTFAKRFTFQCGRPLCHPSKVGPRCPLLDNFRYMESHLILSAESFDACSALRLQDLRALLKDYDVEVIVVHRLYSDHLASYYAQREGKNPDLSLTEWLGAGAHSMSRLLKMRDTAEFDMPCALVTIQCVKMLASVFGAEKVHVVSYDGTKAAGRTLQDVVACDVAKVECNEGRLPNAHRPKGMANVSPEHSAFSASALFNQAATRMNCAAKMQPNDADASNLYRSASQTGQMSLQKEDSTLCLPLEDLTMRVKRYHSLCDECFHAFLKSSSINSYMFEKAPTRSTRVSCEHNQSSLIVQRALSRSLRQAGCLR